LLEVGAKGVAAVVDAPHWKLRAARARTRARCSYGPRSTFVSSLKAHHAGRVGYLALTRSACGKTAGGGQPF
jgi:hypothetical protein